MMDGRNAPLNKQQSFPHAVHLSTARCVSLCASLCVCVWVRVCLYVGTFTTLEEHQGTPIPGTCRLGHLLFANGNNRCGSLSPYLCAACVAAR